MESILMEIIFFREAFCFGEHFLESIFRGSFGGEHVDLHPQNPVWNA